MKDVKDLYTQQQAAAYLGVNRNVIRRLVELGKLRPLRVGHATVYTRKNLDEVKNELYAEGMTHSDIAKLYGVARSSVAYHFHRLKVKPVGRDNRRRGGAIYDYKTVKNFADILGWKPLPQSPTSEASAPPPAAPEGRAAS